MTTSRAIVRWDISLTLDMTYFFHVILNDSEESHDPSEKHVSPTFSVGYFAYAQYDVLFSHVILNDSEESHDTSEKHVSPTFSVGYFAYNQYDVLFSRHKDFINFIFARQSLPLD